jgi:hypothetical protein
MSLDENRPSRELAVCRQEKKTSEKPTKDCGSVVCQHEVGPKPSSGKPNVNRSRVLSALEAYAKDWRMWSKLPHAQTAHPP